MNRLALETLFKRRKPLIGMLHVPALPGSPGCCMSLEEIEQWVLRDAEALAEAGFDGLLIENFGDTPFYPGRTPPWTATFLTRLALSVKRNFPLPLGINVLRNDALSALAVGAATGAVFLRVNVLSGARVTDQGIIEGQAHELLRARLLLGAEVRIFADVAVKHSAALAEVSLEEETRDLVGRAMADVLIVTGKTTGDAPALEELERVRLSACEVPVLAGSGVSLENVRAVLQIADGAIVGSGLKSASAAGRPVDPARAKAFVAVARTQVESVGEGERSAREALGS